VVLRLSVGGVFEAAQRGEEMLQSNPDKLNQLC
jgi:hypothetical protein